jgi:hypothetical protein
VTGFVAVDYTNLLTIVSFRGSASVSSWLTDIFFNRIPVDICSGCTAHWGFWTSWVAARGPVLQAIRTAAAINPGFRIVVTGHSLGGAIASLAAAELRNNGYSTDLVFLPTDIPLAVWVCSYLHSTRSALRVLVTMPSARISLIKLVVIIALRITMTQSPVCHLCLLAMPTLAQNTTSRHLVSRLLPLLISGYVQALEIRIATGHG